MYIKQYKKKSRETLMKLGLDRQTVNYFIKSIEFCVKNKVHPMDIVLTKHFYPMVTLYCGNTKGATDKEVRKEIKEKWLDNQVVFINVLNYEERPTIKKLLTMLLEQIQTTK